MERENPIDYCEYKMDLLCNQELEYKYLVFKVTKGSHLNHFDVYLDTSEDIHQTNESDEDVILGEEVPMNQLKKLYQFLGFALNLQTEESEVE